ncbi:acyltransferase [Okeanomitos corallinicola TIOX110]|uniref:Acyltransferase n=1 Tax=Okeanomitos corallinicola TIOX110 TaxID=3133117 RepID=A0ABZ2UPU9_9CYAN
MQIIRSSLIGGKRLINGLESRWLNLYYRALGVKLNGYVWMRQIEISRNFQDIEIENNCALDQGVILLCSGETLLHPKIYIGSHTYINRHTFLDAIESVTIGNHCAIGPGCYITDHNHGTDLNFPPLEQPMVSKPTKIGDRVWIGANVTILKGVTIGNDTVVGAGSVVTKDLPEKAIAVGVPAKVIKHRTST